MQMVWIVAAGRGSKDCQFTDDARLAPCARSDPASCSGSIAPSLCNKAQSDSLRGMTSGTAIIAPIEFVHGIEFDGLPVHFGCPAFYGCALA